MIIGMEVPKHWHMNIVKHCMHSTNYHLAHTLLELTTDTPFFCVYDHNVLILLFSKHPVSFLQWLQAAQVCRQYVLEPKSYTPLSGHTYCVLVLSSSPTNFKSWHYRSHSLHSSGSKDLHIAKYPEHSRYLPRQLLFEFEDSGDNDALSALLESLDKMHIHRAAALPEYCLSNHQSYAFRCPPSQQGKQCRMWRFYPQIKKILPYNVHKCVI